MYIWFTIGEYILCGRFAVGGAYETVGGVLGCLGGVLGSLGGVLGCLGGDTTSPLRGVVGGVTG